MADFIPGRHAFFGGAEIGGLHHDGQEVEFAFGMGTQLFPNAPVEIYGRTQWRVVLDAGERWFEVAFGIDHEMSGNAAAGWTDSGNYLKFELQWSPDLETWLMGKFVPAPVPVIDLGGGAFQYWSRAIHPIDSAVKTGFITVGQTAGNPLSNGFTSLVVAGTSLALPNFPYDMSVSGTAAQLQTDISAFYPGAVVTGTTAETWSIAIPSVSFSSFGQESRLGWPTYVAGTDPFGGTVYSNGRQFQGVFLDAEGVQIYPKAFARFKISAGSRYNPYL